MSKKKTHRVFAREGDVITNGLNTSRGKVDFEGRSATYVDESTAKEVQERYAGKNGSVIVAKDEQYDRALDGESWQIQYDKKRGDWVKTLHKYRFDGIDTSHIRTTRDNGYVWVWKGGKQVRMKRSEALMEGLEIIPQKRIERRKGAEVT